MSANTTATIESSVRELLNRELFQISGVAITPSTLIVTTLMVTVTMVLARILESAVVRLFRKRGAEDEGSINVAGRLVNYLVLVVGFAVSLNTLGLNLSALFAAGAIFAVGLGFGLQNVVQNFVSGLILLGERVIRVGDVIEVEGEMIKIEHLGMRSAVGRTLDDENVILPNAVLVQGSVKNLTMRDRTYRIRVPVGVAYESDLDEVFAVLEEVGGSCSKDAPRGPAVLLTGFGSSSIDFELSIWITEPWEAKRRQSGAALAIWRGLRGRWDHDRFSPARPAPRSRGRGSPGGFPKLIFGCHSGGLGSGGQRGGRHMIRTLLLGGSGGGLTAGGEEQIDTWRSSGDALLWVIIEDEAEEVERVLLEERFGVDPVLVGQAQLPRHPPKIEAMTGQTFVLLKGLDARSKDLDFKTIQLAMMVGDRFLITRSSGPSVSTEKLLADLESGALEMPSSSGELALRLAHIVVGRFLPILLGVESRTEEMEAEMLASPSDELLNELLAQKTDLRQIMRVLRYHAQVFEDAAANLPPEFGDQEQLFSLILEQIERHVSLGRLSLELTDDLINGYISISAHRLNKIMMTLTVVTVVFVPITFMAGIYGMNFEFIPELGFRYGYFVLLGMMLAVVAAILLVFRSRGWLGRRA